MRMRFPAGIVAALSIVNCASFASHRAVDERLVAFCGPAEGRAGTWAWVEAHEREITSHDPPLPPGGTLVGLLIDHAGRPLESVQVQLRKGSVAPGDTIVRAVFAKAGVFRFDSLEQRDYILDVRRLGFERQWHAYRGVRGVADTLCIPMRAWPVVLGPVTTGSLQHR
jgi:hypothetical protein